MAMVELVSEAMKSLLRIHFSSRCSIARMHLQMLLGWTRGSRGHSVRPFLRVVMIVIVSCFLYRSSLREVPHMEVD